MSNDHLAAIAEPLPVALVTGAAGGIGSAVIERLDRDGWRAVGLDRCPSPTPSTLADVTEESSVAAAVAYVEENHGPIDLLVNAAGILLAGPTLERTAADLAAMLAVNVQGVDVVSRAVAARMVRRRHGTIVTVSSNAGSVPRAGMAGYGASKAAATHYTKALGLELAAYGIRCNVVSPGSTRTPMLAALAAGGHTRSGRCTADQLDAASAAAIAGDPDAYRIGIPLGRAAEAIDIADAVAFLASAQARHITMHELVVDGGASLQ